MQRRVAAARSSGEAGGVGLTAAVGDLDELLERARTSESASASASASARARDLIRSGTLAGYGRGIKMPRAKTTLADLRLHRIDGAALLSPSDSTLKGLRNALRLGVWGTFFLTILSGHDTAVVVELALYTLAFAIDAFFLSGSIEFVAIDSLANAFLPAYRSRVAVHEAGHFLVAYLLGVLPKAYMLAAAEAFRVDRPRERDERAGLPTFSFSKMQAGCDFCDDDFQAELAEGKITSSTLDVYACIALAGISAEYVIFGEAEGGISDIQMLDGILSALGFSQKKADDVVRGAVLNTIALLRSHSAAHLALSRAMSERRSVGECIRVIEDNVERKLLRTDPDSDAQQDVL